MISKTAYSPQITFTRKPNPQDFLNGCEKIAETLPESLIGIISRAEDNLPNDPTITRKFRNALTQFTEQVTEIGSGKRTAQDTVEYLQNTLSELTEPNKQRWTRIG